MGSHGCAAWLFCEAGGNAGVQNNKGNNTARLNIIFSSFADSSLESPELKTAFLAHGTLIIAHELKIFSSLEG